jgi:hypothetical protein
MAMDYHEKCAPNAECTAITLIQHASGRNRCVESNYRDRFGRTCGAQRQHIGVLEEDSASVGDVLDERRVLLRPRVDVLIAGGPLSVVVCRGEILLEKGQ